MSHLDLPDSANPLATRRPERRAGGFAQPLMNPGIDSLGFASNTRGPLPIMMLRGNPAAKSLSIVPEAGCDGVCLIRSRRNDAFFLEALVPLHPIGCIVEKTGAVLCT